MKTTAVNTSFNKRAAAVSIAGMILLAFALLYDRYGTYWKRSSELNVQYSEPVPEEYAGECAHPGTVIQIDYPSRDYTTQTPVTKPAFVYLPYGYDETGDVKYDVIYLMHGWMMQAEDYYADQFQIQELFDHMIENRDTAPFIAISLSFDAENRPQTYQRSVEELALFHYELREYAMPYLETRLHTFAKSSAASDLRASRSHRAFAGFSMGGVTAWHQFIFNLDLIHSFIPMSADSWIKGHNGGALHADATVNELAKAIHRGGYSRSDYFIYAGNGTLDPMFSSMDEQIQEMRKRQEFDSVNMIYGIKENGYHDMYAVREHLFHALPRVFPASNKSR